MAEDSEEKKIKQEKISIEGLEMLNIGTVGHIDHGKTTLLYRLTGKFTDTHSEELKRGITIKLGYAEAIIESKGRKRYVSFVDAPGHEMLMATMLSGAAIIDAAILVIAANEGIKPQTKEHLMALEAKKIKNVIIVQNKIDLVSKEEAKKNYEEIKKFVKGSVAENSPIIPVSAQQEININKLKEKLMEIEIPKRNTEEKPIFLIARSFDINRPGTKAKDLHGGILGGVLKQGKLKVGDVLEIRPGLSEKKANQQVYTKIKTKVVSIHRGTHSIREAVPGGSLALETELDNLLTKADALSGCMASFEGNLPEITDNARIRFRLFDFVAGSERSQKTDPLKSQEMILLNINTSITVGTVLKLKGDEAELKLRIPIVPLKGENIGMARNINGHWRLIGYGEIV